MDNKNAFNHMLLYCDVETIKCCCVLDKCHLAYMNDDFWKTILSRDTDPQRFMLLIKYKPENMTMAVYCESLKVANDIRIIKRSHISPSIYWFERLEQTNENIAVYNATFIRCVKFRCFDVADWMIRTSSRSMLQKNVIFQVPDGDKVMSPILCPLIIATAIFCSGFENEEHYVPEALEWLLAAYHTYRPKSIKFDLMYKIIHFVVEKKNISLLRLILEYAQGDSITHPVSPAIRIQLEAVILQLRNVELIRELTGGDIIANSIEKQRSLNKFAIGAVAAAVVAIAGKKIIDWWFRTKN